jgi:RNA polymerase sigma-70 factor (ECF subfamily)
MHDFNTDIQKIQTPLQKHIRKMVRDTMIAEDLLQETMIIAIRKHETLYDKSKLLPWCKTIARNLYFRQLQRMHDEDVFDEAAHISAREMGQVEASFQNQKTAALLQLLTRLPDSQRILARDYYLLGIPRKDICEKYYISPQVFDSRLLRARKKIQSYLKRRHKRKADIDFINRFTALVKGDYTMDEFRIEISPKLFPDLIEADDNIITFIS